MCQSSFVSNHHSQVWFDETHSTVQCCNNKFITVVTTQIFLHAANGSERCTQNGQILFYLLERKKLQRHLWFLASRVASLIIDGTENRSLLLRSISGCSETATINAGPSRYKLWLRVNFPAICITVSSLPFNYQPRRPRWFSLPLKLI